MLALVLPCEMAALPHVRITFAALELGDVFLKSESIPGRIGGGGRRLPQQIAEVDEMRLRSGPLGKLAGLPAFDKFRQSERCAGHGKLRPILQSQSRFAKGEASNAQTPSAQSYASRLRLVCSDVFRWLYSLHTATPDRAWPVNGFVGMWW